MKTTSYYKLAIRIYEGKLTLQQVYKASFLLGVAVEREYVKLLSAAITAEVNKIAIYYAAKCGVEAVDKLVPLTNLMDQIEYWKKRDKEGTINIVEQFDYFQNNINEVIKEAVTINTENLSQLRNIRYNLGIIDPRIVALGKFSAWVGENLTKYQQLLKEQEEYVNAAEEEYYERAFDCVIEQMNFLIDFSEYYVEAEPIEEYQSLLKQYKEYRNFK